MDLFSYWLQPSCNTFSSMYHVYLIKIPLAEFFFEGSCKFATSFAHVFLWIGSVRLFFTEVFLEWVLVRLLVSVLICWDFHFKVKFNKLREINEILGGNTDVISPAREWVKDGKIVKISARDGSHRERYLFLVCKFNSRITDWAMAYVVPNSLFFITIPALDLNLVRPKNLYSHIHVCVHTRRHTCTCICYTCV